MLCLIFDAASACEVELKNVGTVVRHTVGRPIRALRETQYVSITPQSFGKGRSRTGIIEQHERPSIPHLKGRAAISVQVRQIFDEMLERVTGQKGVAETTDEINASA
jgi:hypothetical protein